jgi:hypothetical protein
MSGEEKRPHAIPLSNREARLAQWALEGFQQVPDANTEPARTAVDVLLERLEAYRKGPQPSGTFHLSDEEVRISWMVVDALRREIEADRIRPPEDRRPEVLYALADRIKELFDRVDEHF